MRLNRLGVALGLMLLLAPTGVRADDTLSVDQIHQKVLDVRAYVEQHNLDNMKAIHDVDAKPLPPPPGGGNIGPGPTQVAIAGFRAQLNLPPDNDPDVRKQIKNLQTELDKNHGSDVQQGLRDRLKMWDDTLKADDQDLTNSTNTLNTLKGQQNTVDMSNVDAWNAKQQQIDDSIAKEQEHNDNIARDTQNQVDVLKSGINIARPYLNNSDSQTSHGGGNPMNRGGGNTPDTGPINNPSNPNMPNCPPTMR